MSKNYYELTYIISPVLEEDEYEGIVKKYDEFITKNGGEIDETDLWGMRRFEYEMDKKSNGYYVNMYFHAPGDLIAKLERTMRIDDHIMRYLTLRYDAKMLRHRELQKQNAVPEIFTDSDEDDDQDEDDS